MNSIIKSLVWISFFGLLSCEENSNVKLHLSAIDRLEYHDEEIIPNKWRHIYGKWKLVDISGGFSGMGYELDFDYLELKSIGIYGLVRNDILFEYGKIEIDTFDANRTDLLQIKLIPVFYSESNPYMNPPEKYIELIGTDTLDLVSPCCDMYNHHFKRIDGSI